MPNENATSHSHYLIIIPKIALKGNTALMCSHTLVFYSRIIAEHVQEGASSECIFNRPIMSAFISYAQNMFCTVLFNFSCNMNCSMQSIFKRNRMTGWIYEEKFLSAGFLFCEMKNIKNKFFY